MNQNPSDHLSVSQINLYLMCGLKYRFHYVDRLPKPFKPSGLAFGSVIHSTIDWFHKQRVRKLPVSLDDLYRVMEADWYCQKCDENIRYKEDEDEKKLLVTARAMLSLYYHRPVDDISESEYPFRIPLINRFTGEDLEVPVEGFIDLIAGNDTIVEFKTSARAMTADSLEDMLQLTVYSYVFRTLLGKEPRSLRVVNFVKTRTPKMNVLEIPARRDDDYLRLFYLAKEVLRGISLGVFFPRKSFICGDCEYALPCGEWGNNERIKQPAQDYPERRVYAYA